MKVTEHWQLLSEIPGICSIEAAGMEKDGAQGLQRRLRSSRIAVKIHMHIYVVIYGELSEISSGCQSQTLFEMPFMLI